MFSVHDVESCLYVFCLGWKEPKFYEGPKTFSRIVEENHIRSTLMEYEKRGAFRESLVGGMDPGLEFRVPS